MSNHGSLVEVKGNDFQVRALICFTEKVYGSSPYSPKKKMK